MTSLSKFDHTRRAPSPTAVIVLLCLCVAGLITVSVLAIAVADHRILGIDRIAAEAASDLYVGSIKNIVGVLTNLGSLPVVAVVIGATTFWTAKRDRWRPVLSLVIGLVLTGLATTVTKAVVDRPRPAHAYVATQGASYPSGHAAYAVGLLACALVLARNRIPAPRLVVAGSIIAVLFVACSRVYLRAHYLSDVLGGIGLGGAIFSFCAFVALITTERSDRRPSGPQ